MKHVEAIKPIMRLDGERLVHIRQLHRKCTIPKNSQQTLLKSSVVKPSKIFGACSTFSKQSWLVHKIWYTEIIHILKLS